MERLLKYCIKLFKDIFLNFNNNYEIDYEKTKYTQVCRR